MIALLLSLLVAPAQASILIPDSHELAEARAIDAAKQTIQSLVDKPQVAEFRYVFLAYPKPSAQAYVCGRVRVKGEEVYRDFIFQPRTARIRFEDGDVRFAMEWNRVCAALEYAEPIPNFTK